MFRLADATPPATSDVLARLNDVIDPEIGIGIVDLGLVYDVQIDDHQIEVTMTVTTPACPLGPYLQQQVEDVLGPVAAHRLVLVRIVLEPPWSPDLITPEGRAQLGWPA